MRWGLLLFVIAWVPGARAFVQSAVAAGASHLVSLEVTGSQRFTSEQIAATAGLHAGSTITKDDMQAAADRLAQLGCFATVQYRFTSVDSGVKVEYQVTDAPAARVLFDNFPWFTDDELDAALKDSVVLFDGAAPQAGAILDAMSAALEKLIATRRMHARVSHTLTNAPGIDQQVQIFRIEGPSLNVQAVEFSDALAKNDRAIQQSLETLIGKPFSRSAFELFEFEQVRPVYFSHAFLRVKFGTPQARFTGNPNRPLPDTVVVLAPVDPGPAYVWNGVAWADNHAIPSSDLEKLVALKPGETADGIKLEAMWQSVRDAYSRLGYLDAAVTSEPQFSDSSNHVSYRVSIKEGKQYHMANLVLTGLSIEGEKRIRAAWRIPPGAVFDKQIYEEFLSTGIAEAFRGLPVHYEKIGRFLQTDQTTARVDVMIDFQ